MVDHNVISAHRLNRSEVDEETAVPARLPLVDVDIDTNEAHSGTAPEDLLQVPVPCFCHLISRSFCYNLHLGSRRRV
jgi:hypothetical protein